MCIFLRQKTFILEMLRKIKFDLIQVKLKISQMKNDMFKYLLYRQMHNNF